MDHCGDLSSHIELTTTMRATTITMIHSEDGSHTVTTYSAVFSCAQPIFPFGALGVVHPEGIIHPIYVYIRQNIQISVIQAHTSIVTRKQATSVISLTSAPASSMTCLGRTCPARCGRVGLERLGALERPASDRRERFGAAARRSASTSGSHQR
jgi:hypothetical protein